MPEPDRTTDPLPDRQRDLFQLVRGHHPHLPIETATWTSGQFNDVLIADDEFVFRFPQTDDALTSLRTEINVLSVLRGRLPIAIPNPDLSVVNGDPPRPLFMGYRKLPGQPLDRATLYDLIRNDPPAFARLGEQIGRFLRTLHAEDVGALADILPRRDDLSYWTQMLEAFKSELFAFMRYKARAEVEKKFKGFLGNPDNFQWQPVLRHGDFGGSNLLYDPDIQRLSGVIDFGAVALGDRAIDLAAISAFHPWLALSVRSVYPELFSPDAQRRAEFYRSTFALQQALWARRAGDDGEFRDGIAAFV